MLELDWARRLCRSKRWRVIDVSGRAVEENASRIVDSFEVMEEIASS